MLHHTYDDAMQRLTKKHMSTVSVVFGGIKNLVKPSENSTRQNRDVGHKSNDSEETFCTWQLILYGMGKIVVMENNLWLG